MERFVTYLRPPPLLATSQSAREALLGGEPPTPPWGPSAHFYLGGGGGVAYNSEETSAPWQKFCTLHFAFACAQCFCYCNLDSQALKNITSRSTTKHGKFAKLFGGMVALKSEDASSKVLLGGCIVF